MAQDRTRRISPKILAEDLDSLDALETVNGYAPTNQRLSLTSLRSIKDDMNSKRSLETRKQAEADAARDDAAEGEWEFHNAIVAMRDQVVAQFGRASNEAQSVGRKKDTERRKPGEK
jgi:hypothetical protein